MPKLKNGGKGDSNLGSLDWEFGVLPLSYHMGMWLGHVGRKGDVGDGRDCSCGQAEEDLDECSVCWEMT